MTTMIREKLYLYQHLAEWEGKGMPSTIPTTCRSTTCP